MTDEDYKVPREVYAPEDEEQDTIGDGPAPEPDEDALEH